MTAFQVVDRAHIVCPAVALAVALWSRLLDFAAQFSGSIVGFARLSIRPTVTYLRFKLAQEVGILTDTSRRTHLSCEEERRREQGRRPPSEFVSPKLVGRGVDITDMVMRLWDQTGRRAGASIHYSFPDLGVQDGEQVSEPTHNLAQPVLADKWERLSRALWQRLRVAEDAVVHEGCDSEAADSESEEPHNGLEHDGLEWLVHHPMRDFPAGRAFLIVATRNGRWPGRSTVHWSAGVSHMWRQAAYGCSRVAAH